MPKSRSLILSISGAVALTAAPAMAQHTEGDAQSPTVQWGRTLSEPGTFWLDSNDDTELIRYTSARDVSICLPEPSGVHGAEKGFPLKISWDGQYSAVLRPGNCFYFDAKRVKVSPAKPLPSGVTLKGRVETSSALQGG